MAQRILILVLFLLAIITSSSLTVLYLQNKSGGSANVAPANLSAEISKFIEENPEIIIQALKKSQMRQAEVEAKKAEGAVKDVLPKLKERKAIAGKNDGDVVFAVFHDFNCGFCRKSVGDVVKVSENFKDVKIVLINLPILGPLSVDKAKVSEAIAQISPEKSFDFFVKMEKETPKTLEQILAIVESIGVDAGKVKEVANSSEVENILSQNRAIAEQVGVQGTPAFIIDNQIIKGALGYDAFANAINKAK
ncbi:MAG: DsbA family protein [Rickettsiales bacterium]|nr:DsbA family protein [Rickettsiales bacterium]